MKSLKRALVTLLVLTMVLGMVSVASAGSLFSDIAGTSAEKAVTRMATLSLLKGYPDGSFKPGGNITRAEFAAVVVRALGLENVANYAKGATRFSDVGADHWASGYINVAVSQGIIKGYPDGTFKPEANVTYAESLTMLVRALGYEPIMTGEWPTNALLKAAELGLTAGLSFNAGAPATRGDVAIMTNKALEVPLLVQTSYGSVVSYQQDTSKSLLATKLGNSTKTFLLTSFDSTNKTISGKVTDAYGQYTVDLSPALATADVVNIVGGDTIDSLKNMVVKATLNKDGKVVYLEAVQTPAVAATTFDSAITANDSSSDTNWYFKLTDGTKIQYTATTKFVVNKGNEQSTPTTVSSVYDAGTWLNGVLKNGDSLAITSVDGKAVYVRATRVDVKNKVLSADGHAKLATDANDYDYITVSGFTYKIKVSGATITLNGNPATVADLKANDVVDITTQGGTGLDATTDGGEVALVVSATRSTIQGTVVGKTTVTSSTGAITNTVTLKLSDGSTKDVTLLSSVSAPAIGDVVKYALNAAGQAVTTLSISGTTTVVKITGFTSSVDANNNTVNSITADKGGASVTYTVYSGVDSTAIGKVGTLSIRGTDGKVDGFTVVDATYDGKVYSVDATNNVVVIQDVTSGVLYVTTTGFAAYASTDDTAKTAGSFVPTSNLTAGTKVFYNKDAYNKVIYILVKKTQ